MVLVESHCGMVGRAGRWILIELVVGEHYDEVYCVAPLILIVILLPLLVWVWMSDEQPQLPNGALSITS